MSNDPLLHYRDRPSQHCQTPLPGHGPSPAPPMSRLTTNGCLPFDDGAELTGELSHSIPATVEGFVRISTFLFTEGRERGGMERNRGREGGKGRRERGEGGRGTGGGKDGGRGGRERESGERRRDGEEREGGGIRSEG